MELSQWVNFLWMGLSHFIGCREIQMEVVLPFMLKKDIPSRQISLKNDHKNREHFFCWNQPPQKKWLISCSYKPHLQFIDQHLTYIGKGLDCLSSKYDDYILMGVFNAELSNNFVDSFCGSYYLKILSKKHSPDFNQQTKEFSKFYHNRNRVIWPPQA